MLIKPFVTEKTVAEQSKGKFTFLVSIDMTKTDVKKSVEKLFGVHVTGVHTIAVRGKAYRTGKRWKYAYKPDSKKAIVTLKSGEKIDLFDLKTSEPEVETVAKTEVKKEEKKTKKVNNKEEKK